MMEHEKFEKQAKEIRKKNLREFCKLVEDNFLNAHLLRNSKKEAEKAEEEGNEVMRMIHTEEMSAHASLYAKNVYELSVRMEILGFNDIKFRHN